MTIKRIMCFLCAAVFMLTVSAAALAQELVPGGKAIGIRMSTDGVVIAELMTLDTDGGRVSPASEAGLKKGDVITKLGSRDIHTAEDFAAAIRSLDGSLISVTVLRGDKTRQLELKPAMSDGKWKLGVALRDGICGVGTLTFYDPETHVYGALGHSISDADSGAVIPLGNGSIHNAQIVSIDKGEVGAPGALNGHSDELRVLGDIRINCDSGIFGVSELTGEPLETGEIKTGKATIYCTLAGDDVGEYEIEVKKIYDNDDTKSVLIKVTDPTLLEKTGGIVQGMSGSPIIQEGKLVGAVTHVFVNDPTSGYGISIQDMLEQEANCCEKAA